MEDKKALADKFSPSQKARYRNISALAGSVALVGSIGGIIYAKKTGGGFWRYVGYWIAGGLVAGIPARLIALPFQNKILREVGNSDSGNAEVDTKISKKDMDAIKKKAEEVCEAEYEECLKKQKQGEFGDCGTKLQPCKDSFIKRQTS